MAVPKKKTSKSKNGMRQAGKGFSLKCNVLFDSEGRFRILHHTLIKKVRKNKEQKEAV